LVMRMGGRWKQLCGGELYSIPNNFEHNHTLWKHYRLVD
jgi:hypothetical protein